MKSPTDFSALTGREIPGGCDDCNAVQTMEEDATIPGVWHLTVKHDDECPFLRARRAGAN